MISKMNRRMLLLAGAATALLGVAGCDKAGDKTAAAAPAAGSDDPKQIAMDAYIYGYSLLTTEVTRVQMSNVAKAALLNAKDSDTIVTGRIGGSPVRVLKNRMSREYVRQEKAGADKMELEKFTLGSLRRAVFEGDTSTGSLMAGQVAGMLHEVRPVADILDDLWNGGRQRIHALSEEC